MEQINYSNPNKRKKKRNNSSFGYFYFVYLCIAIMLGLCGIFYVRGLLAEYEASQPEKLVESEIDALVSAAKDGTLWQKYSFPETEVGELEEGINLGARRMSELTAGGITYSLDPALHEEKTRVYSVVSSTGEAIAKVTLREIGEPVTKLAVFTIQNWEKADTRFVADKKDYRIIVPEGFSVEVNGKVLTDEYGSAANDSTTYLLTGLYIDPTVEIRDQDGNKAEYKKVGNTFKAIYFNYSLTLPRSVTVTVNGEVHEGAETAEGLVRHSINMLTEPDITLSDLWGNTVKYDGGSSLDITYYSVTALSSYKVTVDGAEVPESAYTVRDNPEYDSFFEYDNALPKLVDYDIAILEKDADVVITAPDGGTVDYDKTSHSVSLALLPEGKSIPDDVASEVNVLKIAEDWSLMMSADLYGNLYGFYNYAPNLIEGSQLYKVAYNWVTSIDITFTSYHTLEDPPFTDEVVTNYRRLSDNTFTVDISFTKNMNITGSGYHADKMNSRFTFVKYNSAWKLVNIKEIVE